MNNTIAAASVATSAFSPAFVEAAKTWITYVGVLVVALVTAFAGIRKALRDLKKDERGSSHLTKDPSVERLVGGTILETTTLLMWSESNRDVGEAVRGLTDMVRMMCERIDIVDELKSEAVELRHQIERLRDKL